MEDCIFCKIIKGEIPSFKIYENEYIYAFLNINPIAKGHTLVIPKKHFNSILDCEENYLNEMIKATKLISNHLKEKLNCTGINILNNSGKSAGQEIYHIHFHIFPRFDNDNYKLWADTGYQKEDLKELSESIKL